MLRPQAWPSMMDGDRLEQAIAIMEAPIDKRQPVGRLTIDPGPQRHLINRLASRVGGHSIRRKIKVPLVPPKPKELLNATSMRISRALFGT